MRIVCNNRRFIFDYITDKIFTSGISLLGSEVKSIKRSNCSLKGSYVVIICGELFLINCYVADYAYSLVRFDNYRKRKLLVKKHEIRMLIGKNNKEIMIPTKMFLNDKNLVKLEFALCTARKKYDKREYIKTKDDRRCGEI